MKVTVLKSFSCASDASGTVAVKHEIGREVEVTDDLVPGLIAEGFVKNLSVGKKAATVAREASAELGLTDPKASEKS